MKEKKVKKEASKCFEKSGMTKYVFTIGEGEYFNKTTKMRKIFWNVFDLFMFYIKK